MSGRKAAKAVGRALYDDDSTDSTKRIALNLSNISTATTRTLTVPNVDVTISSFSATLLDDSNASTARTTLGLGDFILFTNIPGAFKDDPGNPSDAAFDYLKTGDFNVVFPPGTYYHTRGHKFDTKQVWSTLGEVKLVNAAPANSVAEHGFWFNGDDSVISGFHFDHRAEALNLQTPSNLLLASCVIQSGDRSEISHNTFENAYDNGVSVVKYDGLGTEMVNLVLGKPSSHITSFNHGINCGWGTKGGACWDVATGRNGLVIGNIDDGSYTGGIVDTGAGARTLVIGNQSNAAKMFGTGPTAQGGFGFYFGGNECTYVGNKVVGCAGTGTWLDGYRCTLADHHVTEAGRHGIYAKRASYSRIVNPVVAVCSTELSGTYDGISVDDTGEAAVNIQIINPQVTGAPGILCRYGINMAYGGFGTSGLVDLPVLSDWATGQMNIGDNPIAVRATNGQNAGTWGAPGSRWDVLGLLTDVNIIAAGDTGNTGHGSYSSKTTPAKHVTVGYSEDNDAGVIQAIHQDVTAKPLLLNPSGGMLKIGRAEWNNPLQVGSWYLWQDLSGVRWSKYGSAPASITDGDLGWGGDVVADAQNANGGYIDFSSGLRVCYAAIDLTAVAIATAYGTSFFTAAASQTWTFPAAFPVGLIPSGINANLSLVGSLFPSGVTVGVPSVTAVNYMPWCAASIAAGAAKSAMLSAVGRWQ